MSNSPGAISDRRSGGDGRANDGSLDRREDGDEQRPDLQEAQDLARRDAVAAP